MKSIRSISIDERLAAPLVEDAAEPDMPPTTRTHWRLQDLDWSAIERERIEHDELLFYLLMAASFTESGSGTYAGNLAAHFSDYPHVASWLREHWKSEELQHGAALAAYVQAVWPSFPWQRAYDSFMAEYSTLCTVEELQDDLRLEMVARCVVETGTTAYYHALRELSREPVLTGLLARIRGDEINHYKHFLKYFKELQGRHGAVGRTRVARVLYARLLEMRESDSDVALRHVHAYRGALFNQGSQSFAQISERVYTHVHGHLPLEQAARMMLKPLALPRWAERGLQPPIVRLGAWVMAA